MDFFGVKVNPVTFYCAILFTSVMFVVEVFCDHAITYFVGNEHSSKQINSRFLIADEMGLLVWSEIQVCWSVMF